MFISRTALLAIVLLVSFSANAQTVSVQNEYSKKIKAATAVDPLSGEFFGNSTNESTGKTVFANVDISLPGNSNLPVELGRRLPIENRQLPEELGGIGNWDIDVPYIEGTFTKSSGWTVTGTNLINRNKRCTTAGTPAVESAQFTPQEVWHGYRVHVPGLLDESMLAENNSYPDPTDGLVYPWILKSMSRVGCITPLKNGGVGEGFSLKTTNGTKYFFDYPVERFASTLSKAPKGVPGYTIERKRIFLLATRIEDRFGNYVTYAYTSGKLTSITANDGRSINLVYGTNTITATANGRNWIYQLQNGYLVEVKLPDGTSWKYSPFGSLTLTNLGDPGQDMLSLDFFSPEHFCLANFNSLNGGTPSLSVTHPSGAVGLFNFEGKQFSRSQVPYLCAIDFFDHVARINLNDMHTTRSTSGIDWRYVFSVMDTNHDGKISSGEIAAGNLDATLFIATDQMPPIEEESSFASVSGYARILIPNYFDVMSLKNVTVSGPGITPQLTQYIYHNEDYPYCDQYDSQTGQVIGIACATPANPCPEYACSDSEGRWVDIILPSGDKVRKRFGVMFAKNEGDLLTEEIVSSAGTVLKHIDYRYLQDNEMTGQPFGGFIGVNFTSDPGEMRVRPLVSTKVQQDEVEFNSTNNSFNNFAQATNVTESSSLGYTRTSAFVYENNLTKWVIGQVKSVTNTNTSPNLVVNQTNYDAVTALPLQTFSFGQLQSTMTYNADGTLATVKDANNNTYNLSSYKRGVPQSIALPDGKFLSGVVNDNGWLTSSTDQLGFATSYGYDTAGRLNNVTYPLSDSTLWNPQLLNFSIASTAAYGLPVGHWYRTVSTGNGKTTTYYDSLWRPVLAVTEDTTNSATRSFVVNRYDVAGRLAFTSYPVASLASVNDVLKGAYTEYDTLGRVTKVKQDSELGLLITTMEYLTGFKTKATNPRGYSTTTSFQVFDEPDTSRPVLIQSPESVTTTITRDVFGKPLSVTRTGPEG